MKKFILKSAVIALLILGFQTPTFAAKLGLYPSSSALKKGCNYNVDIVINTEGQNSRGADAFLTYDANKIEVTGISPGWVFKSYPGKVFGGGNIKITAFSQNGFYNGSGNLARITFRSINDATSGGFNFIYSPGSTVDSNVADENSNDMLSTVWGANYTFTDGPCFEKTPDTLAPWVKFEDLKPGHEWLNMVPNTDIFFIIRDDKSGVDLDSVIVEVNDEIYTTEDTKNLTYEGSLKKYEITIDPDEDFLEESTVNVTIYAKDKKGNRMDPFAYTFGTYELPDDYLRPAAPKTPKTDCPDFDWELLVCPNIDYPEIECKKTEYPDVICPDVVCPDFDCAAALKSAAPEGERSYWLPLLLLIILLISLYFNFADIEFEDTLNIKTKHFQDKLRIVFKKDKSKNSSRNKLKKALKETLDKARRKRKK